MAARYPHDSDPPRWRITSDRMEPNTPPAPERGPVA